MNKENVLTLADYVEASKTFCMKDYFHDCGTPACLAGHGGKLFGITDRVEDGVSYKLGLDGFEAERLFRPFTENFNFSAVGKGGKNYITKEHAVATLQHLAKTGEIDYDKCAPTQAT